MPAPYQFYPCFKSCPSCRSPLVSATPLTLTHTRGLLQEMGITCYCVRCNSRYRATSWLIYPAVAWAGPLGRRLWWKTTRLEPIPYGGEPTWTDERGSSEGSVLRNLLIGYVAGLFAIGPLALPLWNDGGLRDSIGRFVTVEQIHLIQYFGLGVLISLYAFSHPRPGRILASLLMLGGIVAGLDEVVQSLLPQRVFQWSDVGLNATGIGIGLATVWILRWVSIPIREARPIGKVPPVVSPRPSSSGSGWGLSFALALLRGSRRLVLSSLSSVSPNREDS